MNNDQKQPNILWICTDQMRFDTIQSLGNPYIRTPQADRLVKEVWLSQGHIRNVSCSPSRASFLTGRYPRTTGVTKNGGAYFPKGEVLVTKMLADAGYQCGLIGKLHLSASRDRIEQRQRRLHCLQVEPYALSGFIGRINTKCGWSQMMSIGRKHIKALKGGLKNGTTTQRGVQKKQFALSQRPIRILGC